MKHASKGKHALLFVLVLVVFVAAASVTLAYLFKKTPEVKNDFIPASVTCEVAEAFNGSVKSSIKVKNTGNIDAYLRVRLVSYWVDGDGKIVGKPSVMPTVLYDSANWIMGQDSCVWYYTSPVAPNMLTGHDLLTAPVTLEKSTYNGADVYQVVQVMAEAIQSVPADAVTDSWGVTLSEGIITAAP